MAFCRKFILLLLPLFSYFISISNQSETQKPEAASKSSSSDVYLSFTLKAARIPPHHRSSIISSPSPSVSSQPGRRSSPSLYRSRLQHDSMALIASLPFGTPPQLQDMVLDTGSQLSWIPCHNNPRKKKATTAEGSGTASFNPSLSTSFSVVPCNHPLCKPPAKDPDGYAVPTSCGADNDCRYSLFYADGSFSEGNLVREKFAASLPVALGCTNGSSAGGAGGSGGGILGMNLGRLSFASQSKVSRFSYCAPAATSASPGSLLLGRNPRSRGFRYVGLLTFDQPQRMPNCDPLAYTVPLVGMKIGGRRLNISAAAFRPSPNGSGQTMLDSGTEFTYLVDEAYSAVRAEIARVTGARMADGYAYQRALDMCFKDDKGGGGDPRRIGQLIGGVAFVFVGGVEIGVEGEGNLVQAQPGVHCLGIGRSDSLGVAGNIIGNFHQRNTWVEFDLANHRVGFGKTTDCSS